ncbi:hypothetical protein SDC9_141327 [bioreactor metagenome]|uniref:Uncharacterized protein n=1 Tax=bioreactor metagenome TaxID=1076179 RepID=A0A645E0R8_9ZZZZ
MDIDEDGALSKQRFERLQNLRDAVVVYRKFEEFLVDLSRLGQKSGLAVDYYGEGRVYHVAEGVFVRDKNEREPKFVRRVQRLLRDALDEASRLDAQPGGVVAVQLAYQLCESAAVVLQGKGCGDDEFAALYPRRSVRSVYDRDARYPAVYPLFTCQQPQS